MQDVRVLVVDDDHDVALVVSMSIEKLGCSCRVAWSSGAGRTIARSFLPQIAFIDQELGDGSGVALARELRAGATSPIYLIAFTGDSRALACGDGVFDAVVIKPASPAILRAAVVAAAHELSARATEE